MRRARLLGVLGLGAVFLLGSAGCSNDGSVGVEDAVASGECEQLLDAFGGKQTALASYSLTLSTPEDGASDAELSEQYEAYVALVTTWESCPDTYAGLSCTSVDDDVEGFEDHGSYKTVMGSRDQPLFCWDRDGTSSETDLSGDEEGFFDTLDGLGMEVDRDDALAAAADLCRAADATDGSAEEFAAALSDQVVGSIMPDLDLSEFPAGALAGAAIPSFCPDHFEVLMEVSGMADTPSGPAAEVTSVELFCDGTTASNAGAVPSYKVAPDYTASVSPDTVSPGDQIEVSLRFDVPSYDQAPMIHGVVTGWPMPVGIADITDVRFEGGSQSDAQWAYSGGVLRTTILSDPPTPAGDFVMPTAVVTARLGAGSSSGVQTFSTTGFVVTYSADGVDPIGPICSPVDGETAIASFRVTD